MATPLDIGILQNFSIIFPFLLVLVLVYAVLTMTKVFGDNKGIYAFLAFILAVFTLFSPVAVKTINRMAPWFVLLFIFSIFLLISFQIFGVSGDKIRDVITSKRYSGTFFYWVITLVLIIAVGSLTSVLSEERDLETLSTVGDASISEDEQEFGFFQTIFHPKVLGMALLLLIAVFTIKNLASYEE